MTQHLSAITLLVGAYDEGLAFYVGKLGFDLLEDTKLSETKRWVRVAPPGAQTALLLAQPKNDQERTALGNQTGGRVGFFLQTDHFARDHTAMLAKGVEFKETPRHEPYGTVAVFTDPWGNLWDLIEPKTER
ncbi:MAG: VOC family protein [Pseudomonadota bacterium]